MTTVAETEATEPYVEPSQRERTRLIVTLGLMVAIAPLTIDLYLPALPAITTDLLTTPAAAQLTLTGTLAGLALGQLFIGPLSDAIGRRTPLIIGLSVHIVASLLCLLAPNIAVLGVLRVFQGLGTAAATVVATAAVRDKFEGTVAAQVFSRLFLVMGAAPILAPTLGGQVLRLTDWRGVFATLAVLGAVLLVVGVVTLPETLPPHRRRTGGVVGTLRDYGALLRDRMFMALVLVAGLSLASLFSYISGSSFVYQNEFGLSQQEFGLVFGLGAAGFITGSQVNVRLLRSYSPQQILTGALVAATAAALAAVTFAATGFGGLVSLVASLVLLLTAGGLAMPNAPALALSRHGEAAGTAAALLGSIQFGIGAVAAPLVGAFGATALAMGSVIATCMLLALGTLLIATRVGGPAPVGADLELAEEAV